MYKCFFCNKELKPEQVKKRIRCIYCGSKIIYKTRTGTSKVLAR